MKISIEQGERDFTIHLSSKDGAEPFLSIRNCRVVSGSKGDFVSMPAKKMDSGKWFNLVRASDQFQAAVLKAYGEAAPKPAPRPSKPALDDDGLPPF
jgi:DNA-binding cell septation regulator SpoVG